MTDYTKQINRAKAKGFFLSVLKSEGRKYLLSDTSVNKLADLLTERLVQKIEREIKWLNLKKGVWLCV